MNQDLNDARALVSETRPGEFALFNNGLDRKPANVQGVRGVTSPLALPFSQSEIDQATQILFWEYEPVSGVGGFDFRRLWKRKRQERPFSSSNRG
jgi:hypothetical protein